MHVLGSPRGVSEGHCRVVAHLGTGGHGDIQVAKDVLCVLVLHRLPQERQEPSWLATAVPHLNHTQGALARPIVPLDGCSQGVPASQTPRPGKEGGHRRPAPSQGWPDDSLEMTENGSFAVGPLS